MMTIAERRIHPICTRNELRSEKAASRNEPRLSGSGPIAIVLTNSGQTTTPRRPIHEVCQQAAILQAKDHLPAG